MLLRAKSRKDGAERSFESVLGILTPASPLLPEINMPSDPYLVLIDGSPSGQGQTRMKEGSILVPSLLT